MSTTKQDDSDRMFHAALDRALARIREERSADRNLNTNAQVTVSAIRLTERTVEGVGHVHAVFDVRKRIMV